MKTKKENEFYRQIEHQKKVIEILQRHVDEIDRDIENHLEHIGDIHSRMAKLFLKAKRQGFVTAIELINSYDDENFAQRQNQLDHKNNIIRRHKSEIINLNRKNRILSETVNKLIGEKMQLKKELNRYKSAGWEYDIT